MRGPACFSNCSPAPAAVTITNSTMNYQIGSNQIGWRQEAFAPADLNDVVLSPVADPETGVSFAASRSATLASTPISRASVQVFLGGSLGQRPLLAYDDNTPELAYNYFLVGNALYLNFVPDGDIYVHYVGTPLGAASGTTSTGYMTEVAVSAETGLTGYELNPEWVIADGITPYSVLAFADLYAWLKANGQETVLEVDDTTESYAANSVNQAPAAGVVSTGFVVPSGAFVVRYLSPYTRSPLPAPPVTYPLSFRSRSSTHRVIIKA